MLLQHMHKLFTPTRHKLYHAATLMTRQQLQIRLITTTSLPCEV